MIRDRKIHKIFRKAGLAAVTFGIFAGLAACGGSAEDYQPEPVGDGGTLSIGFRVSAPSAAVSHQESRAGDYDYGSDLESAIDFASYNYRVYFFDKENKYLAEWDRVYDMHVIKTADYWTYTFTGGVPEALQAYNQDYKDFSVMVLANWPGYPDRSHSDLTGLYINDFVSAEWAKFEALWNFELSREDGRLIPLYGLGHFTNVTLIKGSACDLGTINLLRAVAKVEIIVNGLPEDVTVDGNPAIHGVNPLGYCAPVCEYGTGSNWATDYVTDLHLPFDSNLNHADAGNNTVEMLKTGENKWIAYLPEFRNIGQDVYSWIEMPLSHRREPFILNFARYDADGRPDNVNGRFDIRRNDLYRFFVKGDLHAIKFGLMVEEWTEGGRTEIEM